MCTNVCVFSLINVKAAVRASQRLALSEAAGNVDKINNEPLNSVSGNVKI